MTSTKAMQARLARLVAGEFRSDDIVKLILYLRQEAARHRVISEIGHFVAHPERTKGMLPALMADTFVMCRWTMEKLEINKHGKSMSTDDLPPNIVEIMQVVRRKSRPAGLRAETGMKGKQIDAALNRLIARISPTASGRAQMTGPIHVQDFKLFEALIKPLIVDVAFTQEDLFADFRGALVTAGITSKGANLPDHLSPWLMLVAIEATHGARMNDGTWSTELSAGTDNDGNLSVTMQLSPPAGYSNQVPFGFPVTRTTMSGMLWFDPGQPKNLQITVPIEIGPGPKLVAL